MVELMNFWIPALAPVMVMSLFWHVLIEERGSAQNPTLPLTHTHTHRHRSDLSQSRSPADIITPPQLSSASLPAITPALFSSRWCHLCKPVCMFARHTQQKVTAESSDLVFQTASHLLCTQSQLAFPAGDSEHAQIPSMSNDKFQWSNHTRAEMCCQLWWHARTTAGKRFTERQSESLRLQLEEC